MAGKSIYCDDRVLTLEDYIEEKVKTLKDLGIGLNDNQKSHLKSLKSEIAVDNFAHDLIVNR